MSSTSLKVYSQVYHFSNSCSYLWGAKVDKSQIQYEDKKYNVCCPSILNCAHVLSVWVVHMFSQLVGLIAIGYCGMGLFAHIIPFPKFLLFQGSERQYACIHKLRENVHNSNWENMHVHNSKLRGNTYMFLSSYCIWLFAHFGTPYNTTHGSMQYSSYSPWMNNMSLSSCDMVNSTFSF